MNYEQDHSHSHCYDTQEGHEKHLRCCICLKWPEPRTEKKCCRKCNPGANGNYQAGMGGCFDPECECHSKPPTDSETHQAGCICSHNVGTCPPQCPCLLHNKNHSDSEDDAIEEIVHSFIPEYSSLALVDEDKVDGYEMKPLEPWLRETLRSYGDKIREGHKQVYLRTLDLNFKRRKEEGRAEEKKASVEYIAEHVRDWKEEGRNAALDELERRMPEERETADLAQPWNIDLTHERNKSWNRCRTDILALIADMRK